jgi:hypothetical protein
MFKITDVYSFSKKNETEDYSSLTLQEKGLRKYQ